ncbi:ABC transporter substrate-binding protein [Ktedonosporobacter rubrisoli]|uniref:ABC transporter substrate-binding protein n=2 Tax=Ktedonosporobacter rubrisoli TaxID=2509675 RepID=A0A4P6K679_KTERU|nr:ABC transporter substrate-binding protein [Ktedonosporobacter rubrisoli]
MSLVTGLLLCMLLLAACGGSGGTTTASNGAANSVLTIVTSPKGDFTENFSPFSPTALDGAKGMMYETLLYFNQEDGSVKPWLAASYKFADDATSVTFNLRQNVKWSDGKPFTSADVVFTLNELKQYPAADTSSLWKVIKDVQAPDANTVVVTFNRPDSPILWYLAGQTYIVPKEHWASVGDPTKYTNSQPVGTGPFTLKAFTPQLVDLVKNPNYWQPGKPAVQELKYPSFNSNTGAELLLSRNQLDWTGLFTPDIQKTYVSRDQAHNHYWFPSANVIMLYLNLAKPPFNQLAVRQAISAALDREQMYKVGESGYEPVAHPTALVLPANKQFLSTDYTDLAFKMDTAKATQLLESAGFKKGSDGIYADSSGKKLSFNINVVTGWTDWVTDCQIMASNLKAIGMNVSVSSLSYNSYINALQMGSYDAAISWTNTGPSPYFLYYSTLSSKNTAAVGQLAPSNWERWNDATTDKLLDQYEKTTDTNAQTQAISGIEKIMVEQMPVIPLVYGATWYEYSSLHFTGWPDKDNPYAVPSPYTAPDCEVVVLNLKPAA